MTVLTRTAVRTCVCIALLLVASTASAEAPNAGHSVTAIPTGVSPSAPLRASSLARDPAAFDGQLPSLSWDVEPDTVALVGSAWRADLLLPSIGVRHRFLRQDRSGLDVSLGVSFLSIGREDAGSELSATLLLARSLGALSWVAAGRVGKGTGIRADVDFDAASLVTVPIGERLRTGVEVRVHGELVDQLHTAEDDGRPIGLIAGSTISFTAYRCAFDVLAGWESPRGAPPPRPVGIVTVAWTF